MNIKVTDLRVGNKVYGVRNGNLKEIIEVGKILWQEIITSIDDGARCFRVEDEVEGIPLSSDILEKCGFKIEYVCYKYTFPDDSYLLWTADKKFEISFWGMYATKAPGEFVHQLQNLFFSLTGQELTVNL